VDEDDVVDATDDDDDDDDGRVVETTGACIDSIKRDRVRDDDGSSSRLLDAVMVVRCVDA